MPTFTCDKYRRGRIHTPAGSAKFNEGVFTTEDSKLAAALRKNKLVSELKQSKTDEQE